MTVGGTKRHVVDLSQLDDLRQGFLRKRMLAFKSVQYDALEQIPERQIFQFGQGPSTLSEAAFQS